MKIIDTHAHYDDDWFDEDREELLTLLPNKGVDKIITQGVNLENSRKILSLAEKHPYIYATVGIHPQEIQDIHTNYIDELKLLLSHPKAVAVGEIGLDYHYDGYDRDGQISVFTSQLDLAKSLGKPCVIHSRDSTKDMLEILKQYQPTGVMHCFSGSVETARELLKLGLYISFTGVLTFKNARKAVEACKEIPVEKLLLETDAPYMAPIPFRGKRCDSSMIIHTAEKMAEIKGVEVETLIKICNNNAERLFGI